jgi:hypothetical protein
MMKIAKSRSSIHAFGLFVRCLNEGVDYIGHARPINNPENFSRLLDAAFRFFSRVVRARPRLRGEAC